MGGEQRYQLLANVSQQKLKINCKFDAVILKVLIYFLFIIIAFNDFYIRNV